MTAPHPALTKEAPPPKPERLAFALDALLHSYGQVVFARSRLAGAGLLAASLLDPAVGAVGLVGVAAAGGLALALGFDREAVRGGSLGANALLVFLGLGAAGASPALWPVAVLGVVLVYAAVAGGLRYHLHLPALSLPFVVTTWLLAAAWPAVAAWPAGATGPLAALGALVFSPSPVAGAVVLAAIAAWSRVAALHAAVGLLVAALWDGSPVTGFNAALTAVALGGVFYVPGPASLALAGGGAVLAAWLTDASGALLGPLPTLALPLNAAVLLVLYALAQRARATAPRPVQVPCASPEETLHHDRTRIRRFHASLPVALALPFDGAWTCTQGNDGAHTHRGAWRHGLDFELADARGRRHRGDGASLTDWLCYRQPVRAMAAGTVVRVVDGVPDNRIGELNTLENWGNLVIVQHAPGICSLVAHLSPGTLRVVEGQHVAAGQVLGLCGNSGRSPVPHLHVQLQAGASPGDPTVAIAFHGVVREGAAPELVREGLPAERERWRNPRARAGLSESLAFPVGARYRLRVREGERERSEWVVSEIDLYGRRSLSSATRGARLWFDHGPGGFVALDHTGPRDGALFALYCGLARVSWDEAEALSWEDWLDPRRVSGGVRAWLADAAGAVLPTRPQRVRYDARWEGSARVITGSATGRGWRASLETEATLVAGPGLVVVRATTGRRTLCVRVEAA